MQADKSVAGDNTERGIDAGFVAGDWTSRVIEGRKTGASVTLPAWLDASYETMRTQVMDTGYPCFFGTMAERRGEMFYAFVNGKDISDLPATMQTFAELASRPEYRKNNIAVFFEPDAEPLSHDAYHALFWNALQTLHNVDPDPNADAQPEPSHEDWEFSFAGVEMFVVCACPSFHTRHSRNLGPGMVLLFQPRSVFVDTITNKVIGREARNQVRKRLETWDDVSAHPDLGFYGDPGNLEWKQYFLTDENTPAGDRCPFLKRSRRVLADGADTSAPIAAAVSAPAEAAQDLVSMMLRHVATQPDRIAVRFLLDGERDEQVLTYGQLHRRALACAERLSRDAQRGDRAILLLPTGLDYVAGFLGCLYAGVIAVPAYPPESSNPQHLHRVRAMFDDCEPRVILTDRAHEALLSNLVDSADSPLATRCTTLLVDTVQQGATGGFAVQPPAADDLAFLQYTSGSTAAPKGVMVSHGNVSANEIAIREAMAFSADDIMVSWLPLYHDMGLIGGLLAPLFVGFPVVLMSPAHFLERPARWLQAVSHYRATVSGGPNFAYQLCAERVRADQLSGVDLSSWRVAFCGAEPIRAATLDGFAHIGAEAKLAATALYPCYGLAEATLLVSGVDAGQGYALFDAERSALAAGHAARAHASDAASLAGATRLVEGGRVQARHAVRIVDPQTGVNLESGRIGEIWFGGPSVAQGYWNNPQASAETFVRDANGERWLRTGDLGFMSGERLYVNGRVKDLIIVRGQNLYPQDIEATLAARVAALRPGRIAAFAVAQGKDGEGIGIAAEISRVTARNLDEAALFAQIEAVIVDAHREPVAAIAILKPGTLPRTSSGKLRRSACAQGWREQTLDLFARYSRDETGALVRGGVRREAGTPTEAALLSIWQTVFDDAGLSCDVDFFALGGQSITATALVARIRVAFKRDVPLDFVFTQRSIASQAAWLDQSSHEVTSGERVSPVGIAAAVDASALSAGQRALWYLWREAPNSSAYNVSGAFQIDGALDVARLSDAVSALVKRHPQLTMRVRPDGANPRAAFDAHAAQLEIVNTDARNDTNDTNDRIQTLIDAPFDLERGPLFRAHLVRGVEGSHALVLSLHHIIADAHSCAVIMRDLMRLYTSDDDLESPTATYADYCAQQNAFAASDAERQQLDFWREALGDASPAARLPADRSQHALPRGGHAKGGRLRVDLPAQLAVALRELANDEGTTLFTVLLSAFAVAIERYSNQSDIRIGVPVSNRRELAFENVVGYFVNTTVVRAQVERARPFASLVDAVQDSLLTARRHADVPFPRVSDALRERGPLFEIMFNLEEAVLQDAVAPAGLALSDLDLRARDVPFELSLDVTAARDGVSLSFSYLARRFDAATIDAFARRYVGLLEQIAANPAMAIAQWQVDGAAASLDDQCERATAFLPLTTRIERQVRETPYATALRCDGESVSYAQLAVRAGQLAGALRTAGAHADESVAILLGRTPALVAAMLGTMQSGACYVPLDAAYPAERIAHMLDDARVRIVITDQAHARRHAAALAGRTLILVSDAATASALDVDANASARVHPDQLAYVVFTSGSTGRPKGVAISHRALASHIDDFIAMHEVGRDDVVLQFSTLSFDASIEQLWPALAVGAAVAMRGDASWDPEMLEAYLRDECVTLADLPTSYWREWTASLVGRTHVDGLALLRTITVGGEAVSADLLGRWQSGPLGHVRFVNTYGPTETTVVALAHATTASDTESGVVPVGRALTHRKAVLLDRHGEAVPVGGVGELCIGGPTLARGYIGRPGISAAVFVPDRSGVPGARLYRTGDLCRQRADGSFDFLGRVDQQLKIRGVRVEPGEIEAALRESPGIADAWVVAHRPAGDFDSDSEAEVGPQLVAYVVTAHAAPFDAAALRRVLAEMLPAVMIPSVFIPLDALPLTANGKLDRRALPKPPEAVPADALMAGGMSPREAQLLTLYREVLHRPDCALDDDFFALGGDSILSLQLVARAKDAGLTLTSRQVFAAPDVRSLAQLVANENADITPHDDALFNEPRGGSVPLTPIQAWFFEHYPDAPARWNQAAMLQLSEPLDTARLEAALHALVVRHDALRLRFTQTLSGEWRQRIESTDAWRARSVRLLLDSGADDASQTIDQVHGSLSLQDGPLLRAALLRGEGHDRLLIAIHHLAVDAVSWHVLLRDLEQLYRHGESRSRATSFGAWASMQTHAAQQPTAAAVLADELDVWRRQLAQAAKSSARFAIKSAAVATIGTDTVLAELDHRRQRMAATRIVSPAWHEARRRPDVLLAALVNTLCESNDTHGQAHCEGIVVEIEGHGRQVELPGAASVDLSTTVGWFTSRFPLWIARGAHAADIAAALATVPANGARWGMLEYSADATLRNGARALPRAEVVFNYLGDVSAAGMASQRPLWSVTADPVGMTGQARRPDAATIRLTLDAMLVDGDLVFDWHADPACIDAAELDTLTQRFATYLQGGEREHGANDDASSAAAALALRSPLAALNAAHIEACFSNPDAIESLHPLSPMQRGMLSHALHAEADPYYVQHVFTLDGIRDPQLFEQAWQNAVERHPMLRTDFHWDGLPVPVQAVRKSAALAMDHRDWRGLDGQTLRDTLVAQWRTEHAQGFDFAKAADLRIALIRTDAERYLLAWRFHHIQLDGWSLAALFNEVAADYARLAAPDDAKPALTQQHVAAPGFGRYADWLAERSFEVSEQWWRDALAGFDERTPVPYARRAQAQAERTSETSDAGRSRYAEQHADLDDALTHALRDCTCAHGVTLNTLMQGAWAWLLSRHSGKRDVVFGMTTAGRSAPLDGIEQSIGLFINTVPLRVELRPESTVVDWLRALQRHSGSVREHELLPLDAIQAVSEAGAEQALFDTVVVFENYPIDPRMTQYPHGLRGAAHLELPLAQNAQGAETFGRNHFALSLVVSPGPQPRVVLAYDRHVIGDDSVFALSQQFQSALAQLAGSPATRLGALGWHEQTDTSTLAAALSVPSVPGPTLLQTVAARASDDRTREADALVFNGERISWSSLWAWSGQIARRLAAAQAVPDAQASAPRPRDIAEPHIAILLPRGPALVAGILAAWRLGAAYVPLDPGHPAQRLAWQIEDCGASLCVCDERPSWMPAHVETVRPSRYFADGAGFADRVEPGRAVHPAQTAYVIYTSGSTGRPKGVAISHGALLNYTRSLVARVPAAVRSAAYVSTPAADLGHTVLFGALWAGWTLHPLDEDCAFDPDRFAAYIGQYEIDLLKIVPSHLASLLQAQHPARVLPRQCLIVGGEATPVSLASRIQELAPRCLLLNHYGPSETTVGAITGVASNEARAASLTLDEPIDAMRLVIVDHDGHAVAHGVAGELCIGGAGLARGYLNQPGRTAERFVPDPMAAGERVYRTGDRARRLASGRIEWLGRIDDQVKIRGFRIEPGEIAAVLRGLPGVRDAAVLAGNEDSAGDSAGESARIRLTGYVCGDALDGATLRQALATLLPDALVPARIVTLAQLPLTKNGKLDRAALEALADEAPQQRSIEAPSNAVEEQLLAIWHDVLERGDIGVLDNFFETGGDSILSLKLIAKARRAGLSLSPKLVLTHPTVRALASQLAGASASPERQGAAATSGAVGKQTLKSWLEELE
ncbi:Linear gramicidin synthase subunit D [Paraburkholderia sediminicola]|uniref:Linear gramicidin synthase subunit D n=1 Tax=Paraburkholderia sediminicola TaxID=458836 RepID=A0A6J5CGP4_9BURK|nr:non-ribosomal peptide synthetase [Paraburkholderia sediminicola]CAB3734801.1 Linear gramicidin synthase subunit D [Paraburkholderia sediminicola]